MQQQYNSPPGLHLNKKIMTEEEKETVKRLFNTMKACKKAYFESNQNHLGGNLRVHTDYLRSKSSFLGLCFALGSGSETVTDEIRQYFLDETKTL